jgi:flagellar basal-body rod modification protein FlgD
MINATTFSTAAGATAEVRNRTRLGRDEFLTLLVTQLRNQDPLSPLAPHEFAAQLAQFSSVEQLTQLNEVVADQADAIDLNTLLGKTGFAASLIGKQVVAEGNQVEVPESGNAAVRIEVGGAGGQGKLVIRDSAGREVATRELGKLAPGRHTLALPAGLAPGSYTYQVIATGSAGATVPVTTYTVGPVDGIHFQNGTIVLRIGRLEVPLDAIAEIETAPAAAPPAPEPTPLTPTGEPDVGQRRRF